jgi:hypothetical protein
VAEKLTGFPSDYGQRVKFYIVDLGDCEVGAVACASLPGGSRAVLAAPFSEPSAPPLTPSSSRTLQELGELLDIRTLPTFVLLRQGAEAARLEGAPQQRPARRLAQAIREHLLGKAEPAAAGGIRAEQP